MDDVITETPKSTELIDPWQGGPVNFVRENTIYKQQLFFKGKPVDFKISGKVSFTIEPRCTFETNEFTIYSKSGKISLIQKLAGC